MVTGHREGGTPAKGPLAVVVAELLCVLMERQQRNAAEMVVHSESVDAAEASHGLAKRTRCQRLAAYENHLALMVLLSVFEHAALQTCSIFVDHAKVARGQSIRTRDEAQWNFTLLQACSSNCIRPCVCRRTQVSERRSWVPISQAVVSAAMATFQLMSTSFSACRNCCAVN